MWGHVGAHVWDRGQHPCGGRVEEGSSKQLEGKRRASNTGVPGCPLGREAPALPRGSP